MSQKLVLIGVAVLFNLIVTYDSIPIWILWEWIGEKGDSMNN